MHYLSHLAETGAEFIHPGGRYASEIVIDALEVSDRISILDIGCGSAATLALICQKWDVNAVGLDCLPEMLGAAQKRPYNGSSQRAPVFVMGRAERLPFGDSMFDRVYAESVLAVLSTREIRHTFREVRRVLKSSGKFIVNDGIWKEDVASERALQINEDCIRKFGLRQSTEEPWTRTDWIRELNQAGLSVESSDLLNIETPVHISLVSRAFAALRKLWSLGSIRHILRFMLYRHRLHRMKGVGLLLEGRVFVARPGYRETMPIR